MSKVVINYTGREGSTLTHELQTDATQLYMWEKGVTSIDLSPLTRCPNLEKINLSSNDIQEIDLTPLASCHNLRNLNLSSNKLQRLDLSPLFFCQENFDTKFNMKFDKRNIVLFADSRLQSYPKRNRPSFLRFAKIDGIPIQWVENILSPDLVARLDPETYLHWEDESGLTAESKTARPASELEIVKETKEGVNILRGGEIVGGKIEYKVKVSNSTNFVVTNVTVTIVAYPADCMEISGGNTKTISRIEPTGFRSPQFTFTPTKDCVEGQLLATVSYVDHENKLHVMSVEPYTIRSVCDLLTPLESSTEAFEKLIVDMEHTSEEQTLDWNSQVLFSKAQKLLPSKNFHVIDSDGKTIGGQFTGTIRGFAEGKYTGKKVAVQALISGPVEDNRATVVIEGMGEDKAMLPTTIEEISIGIGSWICLNCGGAIDVAGVTLIKDDTPTSCQYCRHTLTIDLYRK